MRLLLASRFWLLPSPRPAQPLERTVRVADRGPVPAGAHHAEVTERKVVPHGILGIEPTQRGGDVDRHLPAGARPPRETQATAKTNRVRIERHDELTPVHARPAAGVNAIEDRKY